MGDNHYRISEASKKLNVEDHVLRYWEEDLGMDIPRNEMGQVRPVFIPFKMRFHPVFHISKISVIRQIIAAAVLDGADAF